MANCNKTQAIRERVLIEDRHRIQEAVLARKVAVQSAAGDTRRLADLLHPEPLSRLGARRARRVAAEDPLFRRPVARGPVATGTHAVGGRRDGRHGPGRVERHCSQ